MNLTTSKISKSYIKTQCLNKSILILEKIWTDIIKIPSKK